MAAPCLTCAPPCAALLSLLLEVAASGALADAAAWLAQPLPPMPRAQRRREGRGRLPQASPDAAAQVGLLALRGWLSGWVGEGACCSASVREGARGEAAPLAPAHTIPCCYPVCVAHPPLSTV